MNTHRYPLRCATRASPTPVFPLVGSTMVPPGRSSPEASAASIIRSAIRSLMDPPGLRYSTLASTVALSPAVTVLSRTSGVPPTSSEMCPATFMPPSPGGLEADQGEHEDADQRDPEDGEDGGPDEPRSGGRPRTEVPAGDAAEGGKGADVERTDPHGGRAGLHTGALARSVQGEREDRVAPEHAGDQPRRTKEQRGRPVAVAVGDPVHRQGDQQAGGEHERDGQRSRDQQELGHPQHEHDEHLGDQHGAGRDPQSVDQHPPAGDRDLVDAGELVLVEETHQRRMARIRRNSRYSQTSVTTRPNAAVQANFAGTPFSTPRLIESKSMISAYAARPTAKIPMITPSGMPSTCLLYTSPSPRDRPRS